jgi:uncharacterized membrane protein
MRDSTARRAVWSLSLLYFLFFGLLVILKSQIYQNSDDTPLYTQALWSTLQGHPYGTTWLGVGGPGGSLLGLHFELTLILLTPIYALWPSPDSLLLLQVLFIALTAYPIYTCAVHLLKKPIYGLCLAAAHLANPFVQRALFYDFHHEFLVYFALTWAASLLIQERYRLFLLAALLAALTREDSLLHIFALGLFALVIKRQWKLGIGTMAASVILFFLITSVLIPHFRAEPNPILANRYPELGEDMQSIVRTVIFKPGILFYILRDPDNLRSLVQAILPLGLLPLLSLSGILLMAPAIAEIYLTQVPSLKHLELLYPFVVMPLFPFAAMLSLSRWTETLRWRDQARLIGVLLILGLSLYSMLFYDGKYTFGRDRYHAYYLKQFPLSRGFSWNYFLWNDHERIGRRFISENVPPEVPLATEYRFAADLSNRSLLKPPTDLEGAELVLFDLHGRPYVEAIESFEEVLRREDFGVVAFEDGYTLLKRGADRRGNLRILALMERRFEAEELAGETGSNVADYRSTNRVARLGRAGRDPPGLLTSGPGSPLAAGRYEAVFSLKTTGDSSKKEEIALLEVFDADSLTTLARRSISRDDLPAASGYKAVSLAFESVAQSTRVEFRILFRSTADLWVDRIELAEHQ